MSEMSTLGVAECRHSDCMMYMSQYSRRQQTAC